MEYRPRKLTFAILTLTLLISASLSCLVTGTTTQTESAPLPVTQVVFVTQIVTITPTPMALNTSADPEVILQRLNISFLGQDNNKVIGSGCPGTDGKGTIVDYHFIVSGVDENKDVQRVLVAGDNSTLTWAWPCTNNWALAAENLGNGFWEIFIAPSLPSEIYTVLFFYSDNSIAMGMVNAE